MPSKRRRTIVHTSGGSSIVEDSDEDEVEVSSLDEIMSNAFTSPMSTTTSALAPGSSAFAATTSTFSPGPVPPTPAVISMLTTPELEEIPQLVLIELHKNDIVSIVRALKKLYVMLRSGHKDSLSRKRSANLMGAAPVVVRVMRQWQHDQVIQVRGCNCLRRLSSQNIDGVCAIAQSGGVEATIDAMKAFPQCPYVHNRAVGVLQNTLSVSIDHPAVLAVTFRFVNFLSGLQLVLRAMTKFPDDAVVQADCCALFYNLALEETLKETMAKAGVVSTVALAFERHMDNEEVREEVENFMLAMFAKKGDKDGSIGQAEAVSIVHEVSDEEEKQS